MEKAADKVAENAEPMAQKATDAVLEQTDKVSHNSHLDFTSLNFQCLLKIALAIDSHLVLNFALKEKGCENYDEF